MEEYSDGALKPQVVDSVERNQGDWVSPMSPAEQSLEGTKLALLERLVPQDRHVLQVAHEIRIRESAIRRHFDHLENKGYVEGYFQQEGLGRPKKYYRLTDKGKRRYPDPYVQRLRGGLDTLVRNGTAANRETAAPKYGAQRVENYRSSIEAADTPLAFSRAVERAFTDTGVIVRGRPMGPRKLIFDWTGSLVLARAIGQQPPVSDALREKIFKAIVEAADPKGRFRCDSGPVLPTAPKQ